MADKCLFSAPFSFLGDLREAYLRVMPTEFREIWHRSELQPDSHVTAWVPNPGQGFVIDDAALDHYPNVHLIVTPSTGTNHIDREACTRRGVAMYGLLDHRSRLEQIAASAEFTFLLLLSALRRIDRAFGEVAHRRWRTREDELRGRELAGRTVGLLGYGRIGRRVARFCRAFEAQVRACDPYVTAADVPLVDIETLFAEHDVVVVCCSLTPETSGMVGAQLLGKLKPGAVLVNTARGEIVDEFALADLLRRRPDVVFAADVLAGEVQGQQFESPLLALFDEGRILLTPHIAGATVESQTRAALAALELLAGRGTPIAIA